jgi:citrate/tricarballylate utilization protein
LFIAGAYFNSADSLFTAYDGKGSFFKVIPYEIMTLVSGLIFFHVIVAFIVGFRRFWTENGDKMSELADLSLWKYAMGAAATLKHLDGGDNGHGCNHIDDRFGHSRKWFHHGVMYGFILTLISTTLAAIYHHFLGLHAPYDFDSLVVITGTLGGILMVIGCIGLTYIKIKADPVPMSQKLLGMDYSFIAMLALVNITGLLLLVLRDGAWMPSLLCIHLGFVLAFFLIMPYCKFVHLLYRLGALLKYAKFDRQNQN